MRLSHFHLEPVLAADLRDFLFRLPPLSSLIGRSRTLRELTHQTIPEADCLRVAVLGDCTTDHMSVAASLAAGSLGIPTSVYESPFDSWRAELDDSNSALHKFHPHVALVVLTDNTFQLPDSFGTDQTFHRSVEEARNSIDYCHRRLRDSGCEEVIFHNLVGPTVDVAGRQRKLVRGSSTNFALEVNRELMNLDGYGLRLLDVASLAEYVGISNWRDDRLAHFSKHPFSPQFLSKYCLLLRGTIAAIVGRSSKVLVTDLDNTLWAGTLDDEGPEGITFGIGSPVGEAHLSYAKYLKGLRNSGILLAINSKNDFELVKEAFKANPAIPLKLDDFSSVQCHWGNKSEYMKLISLELNISLDSMVLVDDDQFQREEVRTELPEVSVVPLGTEPSQYVSEISRLHVFDRLTVTDEDRHRADTYRMSRSSNGLRTSDYQTHLKSSNMLGNLRRPTTREIPRMEQLLVKTNQFNLTQLGFDQIELENRLSEPSNIVLVGRLTDRFADYGIVAAIVGRLLPESVYIDNWVVSCRVFSRTYEEFMLSKLLMVAQASGLKTVEGMVRDSGRNQYAKAFLEKYHALGISKSNIESEWKITIGNQMNNLVTVNENL